MTGSRLEHVVPGEWGAVTRNFERLMGMFLDTGGTSAGVRFGTLDFTFEASVASSTVVQPHGLGKAPVAVFVADWWVPGTAEGAGRVDHASFDATGFSCFGSAKAAWTGSVTTSWIAIG